VSATSSPALSGVRALVAALGPQRVRHDVPLAPHTTFRIGGPADLVYEATSADELARVVTLARAHGVPHVVLGLGANVLVGDRGVRGLVVLNRARRWTLDGETGRLWAESGAVVGELVLETVRRGWSGLEHYAGIPSTVGGALWQNLHFLSPAPARERTMFIAEVFESCEILSAEGERRVVGPDYVAFGYDDSVFHHRADLALAATFQLARGDATALHRTVQENLSWRGARHPWLDVYPSAGSIFKKIEGVGAGRLIDECGLKGHRIGGAQIYHLHANIVVNAGGATAADVLTLVRHAQATVEARFGQRLEPEVNMLGEF
jgi:UDP-N-acetylmuramate dehydrogenase